MAIDYMNDLKDLIKGYLLGQNPLSDLEKYMQVAEDLGISTAMQISNAISYAIAMKAANIQGRGDIFDDLKFKLAELLADSEDNNTSKVERIFT